MKKVSSIITVLPLSHKASLIMQIVFTLCFKCVDKPFLTLTDWHCLFIVGNGQAGVVCNDQVKDGAVAKPVPVFKAIAIDKEITSVACGKEHALLLTSSGTVYTLGSGRYFTYIKTTITTWIIRQIIHNFFPFNTASSTSSLYWFQIDVKLKKYTSLHSVVEGTWTDMLRSDWFSVYNYISTSISAIAIIWDIVLIWKQQKMCLS